MCVCVCVCVCMHIDVCIDMCLYMCIIHHICIWLNQMCVHITIQGVMHVLGRIGGAGVRPALTSLVQPTLFIYVYCTTYMCIICLYMCIIHHICIWMNRICVNITICRYRGLCECSDVSVGPACDQLLFASSRPDTGSPGFQPPKPKTETRNPKRSIPKPKNLELLMSKNPKF